MAREDVFVSTEWLSERLDARRRRGRRLLVPAGAWPRSACGIRRQADSRARCASISTPSRTPPPTCRTCCRGRMMLETVAIIGPARFGVPLTQAITAPMLGRARGAADAAPAPVPGLPATPPDPQHRRPPRSSSGSSPAGSTPTSGTYDALGGTRRDRGGGDRGARLHRGRAWWCGACSPRAVQVMVYRRGLRSWDAIRAGRACQGIGRWRVRRPRTPVHTPAASTRAPPRSPPAVAFGLLLSGTSWPLLGAVAAWLALAAAGVARRPVGGAHGARLLRRPGRGRVPVRAGGRPGPRHRGPRAAPGRACSCWWPPGCGRRPGSGGLREVGRRALGKLRRLPAMPEASAGARGHRLGGPPRRPRPARSRRRCATRPTRAWPLVDAVLGWVVREASAEVRSRRPRAGAEAAAAGGGRGAAGAGRGARAHARRLAARRPEISRL